MSTAPLTTGAGRNASASGAGGVVLLECDKSSDTDHRAMTLEMSSEDATRSQCDRMRRTQVTERF